MYPPPPEYKLHVKRYYVYPAHGCLVQVKSLGNCRHSINICGREWMIVYFTDSKVVGALCVVVVFSHFIFKTNITNKKRRFRVQSDGNGKARIWTWVFYGFANSAPFDLKTLPLNVDQKNTKFYGKLFSSNLTHNEEQITYKKKHFRWLPPFLSKARTRGYIAKPDD